MRYMMNKKQSSLPGYVNFEQSEFKTENLDVEDMH